MSSRPTLVAAHQSKVWGMRAARFAIPSLGFVGGVVLAVVLARLPHHLGGKKRGFIARLVIVGLEGVVLAGVRALITRDGKHSVTRTETEDDNDDPEQQGEMDGRRWAAPA